MMRSMRARVMVVLVGLSLVGSACTNGGGSDPPVQDPRARLDALGERWMTTVATITYRTTRRDPGEATSAHQCLRQLVGEREFDVQTRIADLRRGRPSAAGLGAFGSVAD
jgi:hypothetical protein